MGRSCHLLWALPLLLASACGARQDVIAEVGRNAIAVEAFQSYLEAVTGVRWQAVEERVASRLLDQFLDQEVVLTAAEDRRSVVPAVDPAARSAATRSLLREVCGTAPTVPDAAVEEEIARRMEVRRPARARVRQMLVDSLDQAVAARRRLGEGEDFVAVSRAVSRAPNAEAGGALGFVEQGTLPAEIDDVIFGMAEGEISQPVASPAGYHIFQVLEVIPEGPPRRSEVEAAVRGDLAEDQARDLARECVERLAGDVGVALYRDHLWFRYQGRYGGE